MKTFNPRKITGIHLPAMLIVLLRLFFYSQAAFAIDLSDVPLEIQINAPAPMIMLVWDDSSSMDSEFLTQESNGFFDHKKYLFPDEAYVPAADHVELNGALDASGRLKWRSQWAGYNRLYFDPLRRYRPWPSTGKNIFHPADLQQPWSDPARSGEGCARIRLGAQFLTLSIGTRSIVIPNAHYFVVTDVTPAGAGAVYLVTWPADGDHRLILGNSISDDRRRYFRFDDDGDGRVEADELHPVNDEDTKNALRPMIFDPETGRRRYQTDREELQNFANWFTYHRRRELAAKAAAAKVIAGLDQAYVGIYSINHQPRIGIEPVGMIDGSDEKAHSGNREKLLDALYTAESSGESNLRRALDRVGRYYDQRRSSSLGTSPFQPEGQGGSCQGAHAVIFSDGFWDGDFNGAGNADGDQGVPYADGWSDTLADVAMFYYKKDLAPGLSDNLPAQACDTAAHQHMRTHAVALGVSEAASRSEASQDPCLSTAPFPASGWPQPREGQAALVHDLLHAVVNGRGNFSPAENPQAIIDSLNCSSGTIPQAATGAGVAANDIKIDDGFKLYRTRYDPVQWTGDLLAFALTPGCDMGDLRPQNALWRAADHLGASGDSSDARLIVTYGGPWRRPQGVPFRYTYLSDEQKSLLGSDLIRESRTDRAAAELIDFVRGRAFAHMRKRSSLLGDIVHSAPVLAGDTIFAGANDGMLHAFDAATGKERFAYVPNLVLHRLATLAQPGYPRHHRFYVDATPYVGEVMEGPYERTTFLLGGLGKGGKGYYCLCLQTRRRAGVGDSPGAYEVTADYTSGRTEMDISRMVQWEYPRLHMANDGMDNDGDGFTDEPGETDPDIGYGFGQGYVVNANAPQDTYRPVAVFSNGYNSSSGKAVLYILEAATGKLIRKIDTGADDDNGLSVPALIDVNLDRCVDYAYAGDLKGNLWKFDLTAENPSRWGVAYGKDLDRNGVIDAGRGDEPEPVFRAGPRQPITGRPDIMVMSAACAPAAPGYMIVFGTGKYLGESDRRNTERQSIYGIWDYGDDSDDSEFPGGFSDPSRTRLTSGLRLAHREIIRQYLRDGSVYRQLSEAGIDYAVADDTEDKDGINANNKSRSMNPNPVQYAGWVLDLPAPPDQDALPGERVTGRVVIRNGQALVASYAPTDRPCENGGYSWVYPLSICGGEASESESAAADPLLPKRYEGRINDAPVIVKHNAAHRLDAAILITASGKIVEHALAGGEIWGNVYWRQNLEE